MHERHALNKIFAMAMDRLYDQFNIDTVVALTRGDKENQKICLDHAFDYVTVKNHPVSDKFNAGMELLRDKDWTHVMILGSDDIPSNKFIELQMVEPDYDFIAISDMWFWGLNPKRRGFDQFYYWRAGSSRLGAGRTISRKVIEACDYKLWPSGFDSGLDGQSWTKISGAIPDLKRYSYAQKTLGGFLVDIKYELHINSMSPILKKGEESNSDIIWDHLPFDECEALFRLRAKIKKENFL